ncbi:hypothetical protein MLD38_033704 [Melastoma candidum]|uniref:Uncharacterized protein n=1 Tax=Melastoma candidum TaxID=119954 RepID=A0ACB9M836_9MYRT|nr:hypothetical protein MLD38_033704 [Melastoma candidum]
MATGKACGILLLLVCSVMILGENSIAKACPQDCLDVSYMTCPPSGDQQRPSCNCCVAPKGCTLYLSDGSGITCS